MSRLPVASASASASAFVLVLLAIASFGSGCGASDLPIGDDQSSSGVSGRDGGQACGGLAGLVCRGGQRCVDDPSDSCDPANGGADCPGICVSNDAGPAGDAAQPLTCGGFAGTACPSGMSCVDDPNDNCSPGPQGGADCSGICVANGGDAGPAGDAAEPLACGGFAGIACPNGMTCVDDPRDSCDPGTQGGADCPGICR